ncbi:unnamed protein product [Rhizoctonia solani]|uniref:Mitochondrial import inner membrane translocase subunit n=1 Tax=Rhizoctonia solani TaxID=456999 RepID=A0A8H3CCI6_9AGAM|nr:unnamed protein product [Rhizoctonia solani]
MVVVVTCRHVTNKSVTNYPTSNRLITTMDFSNFNAAEQAHMTKIIEKKQMQDFLKLYSGLVERCFNSCVNDFTSKSLGTKEDTCIQNCVEKFMKHSERVGARFAEQNADAQQAITKP